MSISDWVVVGAYVAIVLGIGAWFARRAGTSADEYLVAGRNLPWWVIGLSDVATSAGADAFWVLVVFQGAFVGLHRFFWIGAVVALPLGILWARYWRRLALLSPGQIFEERYGGVAAGRFRGFFAGYGALLVTGVVLAYVLQGFAQIMAPFVGWEQNTVLLVFCGISMLYTTLSGLLGVAYSDVPQFVLLLAGRVILAVLVVGAAGGMGAVLDAVEVARTAEFLRPYPPSTADLYGKWAVEPATLMALAVFGLFSVAGTQSVGVQRSLAARTEADAALGQVLNAVLSLVVRVVPLICIGLAAIALLPVDVDATDAWGTLVRQYAGPGVLGLLLAALVAGYMSTIDSFLNFMVAGLFNDLYRRHLRPDASSREQVWFCRLATVGVTLVGYLWARVLMGRIDADWINFMNSVLLLVVLPLTVLRWTWWRLNIWGEIVGFVAAVPMAWVVWFPLGFKEEPYWQSFLLLFGLGWAVILVVTLATPAEDPEVLARFYRKVRPPGFWGPVARSLGEQERSSTRAEIRLDLVSAAAAFVFCSGAVTAVGAGFARQWLLVGATLVVAAGAGVAFVKATLRADARRPAAHE